MTLPTLHTPLIPGETTSDIVPASSRLNTASKEDPATKQFPEWVLCGKFQSSGRTEFWRGGRLVDCPRGCLWGLPLSCHCGGHLLFEVVRRHGGIAGVIPRRVDISHHPAAGRHAGVCHDAYVVLHGRPAADDHVIPKGRGGPNAGLGAHDAGPADCAVVPCTTPW